MNEISVPVPVSDPLPFSTFNALPFVIVWFFTQTWAGIYAGHQTWGLAWRVLYTFGGAFSLAGSFIHYVFGLLL